MNKIYLIFLFSFAIGCANYQTNHLVRTEKGIYRFYSNIAVSHKDEIEFCKSDKNMDNIEKCKPVTINYGF